MVIDDSQSLQLDCGPYKAGDAGSNIVELNVSTSFKLGLQKKLYTRNVVDIRVAYEVSATLPHYRQTRPGVFWSRKTAYYQLVASVHALTR